tara:strand:+ start:13409 stop:22297 length:8889 start_codon:yes stop_codon:yes gene_type:complete
MNEEVLQQLYDSATTIFDLPPFEQFVVDMQDEAKLDRFRESMSEHFDIPDIATFKEQVGFTSTPTGGMQEEVVQTETQRVGTEGNLFGSALGGLAVTDDEEITSDITPQEGVATITEDVQYDEKESGVTPSQITYDEDATPFERSLAFVNRDLFTRDEEPVVDRLNYHFNDYGFTFEESGVFDNVTVTAPNGATEEFAIDSWIVADNSQEARALRDFIRKNQDSSIMQRMSEQYDASKKKYFSSQARINDINLIRKSSADLVRRQKAFFERKQKHEQNMLKFSNAPSSYYDDPEFQAAYQAEIEEGRYLKQLENKLTDEYKTFSDNAKDVDIAVGNHLRFKQNEGTAVGTFVGGMYDKFIGYFDSAISTLGGTGIEAFYKLAQGFSGNDYGMTDEEYRLEFIRVYEGYKGIDVPDYAKESEEGFAQWLETLKIKEERKKSREEEGDFVFTTMEEAQKYALENQLQGNIFDRHVVSKNDTRLSKLPKGVYDISKGVRYDYGSSSILGIDQPRVKYNEPQVWSIEEDGWVDAPRVFGALNVFEEIDSLVGDQKIKARKKDLKSKSRDRLQNLIGAGVSEERIQAQMDDSIIATGLYGAAESLPALIPMIYQAIKRKGKVKVSNKDKKMFQRIGQSIKNWATDGYRQSSLIAMSLLHADKLNEQMEANPEFEWVTEGEKKAIVLPLAITSGILETLGFRNLLSGTSGTQFIQSITTQALAKLPKGATPAMFRRAVVNIMDNKMTRAVGQSGVYRFGSAVVPAALAEAETGFLQELTDIEGKNIYNAIKGKEMFKNPDRWSAEYFKQLGHAAAAEAVGGFALATPGGIINGIYGKDNSIIIDDEMIELFDSMKNDDTFVEGYKTKLDLAVAQGEMSKAEAKSKLEQFNVLRSASMDLDMATDLSKSQKKEALQLIFRKKRLETEMDGMDKDLGSYKEKQTELEIIKMQLGEIGSKQAQNQANLKREQEGIPQMVTEEDAINELKKEGVENPTPEQIKIKQDALQKSSTTKVDAQESTESGSQVGESVSESESSQQSTEGIDTQTESPEVQDETQEEVSQETKEDIDAFFDETQDTNEIISPNISRNKGKQVSDVDANLQTTIIKNAKKAASAINKLFPKVRIVIHDNSELFKKTTGKEGRGYFNPDTETIHINMQTASKSTPFHEAVHAMANQLIKTDAAANKVFGRMLVSLNKVLPKEGNLQQRINSFTQQYESEEQNEEAVSELFGILASEYKTLTKPTKNKVIDLINRFLNRIGVPSPFSEQLSKSDEAVIDFLNTVAGKLRRGEEILQEDVQIIEDINAEMDEMGTSPIGNPTTIVDERKEGKEQKVSFDGTYSNSLITPASELDIDALIEDIAKKKQKVWFWMADQLGIGTVDGVSIDGGPSYAFVPEHQQKNIIWASGMSESALAKNSEEADYIFIVSGSPTASKLANKKVYDLFISKLGSFEEFKNSVSNFAKPPLKVIRETLAKYDSWDAIRNAKSNKVRKQFLAGIVASEQTPNTELHKLLKDSDAFVDLESLRDGFYKDNNFKMNDIMLVLKPTGAGQQSNHSTYTNDILGEVVGVPNKLVNAYFLLPASMKAKYGKVLMGAQASQVIAPYGSGIRNIESQKKKSKPQTETRKGKEQKTIDQLLEQTQMDVNGFYSKFADMRYLQKEFDAISPGYKVKRAKVNQYGQGGGVYVLKPRGGMLKPKDPSRRGKFQKMDAENEAMDIVMRGREAGFKDSAIKYYLRRRGFKAKEIADALKFDTDLFNIFPKSFANVEGGLKKGVAFINKLNDHYKKLVKANNRKRKNKKSNEDLVNETIEFMYTTPEYKNLGTKGSRKTAQQQALEVDLLNYLSPDTSARNGQRILNLNKNIREMKWSQKEGKRIQRKLRQYIRSVIPRELYTKSQVIALIDKINAVTEENFEAVVKEVTDVATTITNKQLNNNILDILNRSYETVQSGRLKGTSITKAIKDRINSIQENIIGYVPGKKGRKGTIQLPKEISQNEIDEVNSKLLAKIEALEKETISIGGVKTEVNRTLTPEEAQEVADLGMAVAYNNTLSMEQNNGKKTNAYEQILFGLSQLQSMGITGLQLELLRDSTKYMNNTLKMLKEMGVSIDPEQELKDEGVTNITQGDILAKFRELKNKIKIDATRGKIKPISVTKRLALGVKENIKAAERYVFGSAEDLAGLMDRISLSTGELFGGFSQEMVSNEIRKASRIYKGRMLRHELGFSMKMTELYGKRWTKFNRRNSNVTEAIVISQAKQDILEKEEARVKADKTMESGEKEVLLNAIYKEMNENTKMLSQNEILYFRNQGLDPSLEGSFEATFEPTNFSGVLAYLNQEFKKTKDNKFGNKGEYASRIKAELEEKLDDKLVTLGDWMVQEFYPAQYEHYNKTYQKVYRADMPWNQYYAGRLYRDGEDITGVDLLASSENKTWITNVSAASTKFRQENISPIRQTNAVDALLNYTRDMEYFAAYAIPIRDINKVFSDSAVKEVIAERFGNNINKYINDQITKIANKGAKNQKDAGFINFFNNTFLLSRLGFNPTLILKQMTSFVTYGNDIGYDNWIKYAAMNPTEWKADLREIMDNSVVLQDRYGKPITRVIETYQDRNFKEMDAQNNIVQKVFNREVQNQFVNTLMSFTMLGDKGAIMLGGLPNYRFYKAQYLSENENATEQDAIDYAIKRFEQDTLRTQQSYDLQDKDYFQTGNVYQRAFNMFLTTPKQYLRREIIAARNFYRKLRSGNKQGKGTYWQNLRTLMVYHFIMPTLFRYVSLGAPGLLRDRRDDDKEELVLAGFMGNLNALFIIGDLLNIAKDTATGKYWAATPSSLPVIEQAANMSRLYSQANKTKDPIKKQEYTTRFYLELTTLTGIPGPQLKRLLDNYMALAEGPEDMGDAILKLFSFSDYIQSGPQQRTKKPKSPNLTRRELQRYFPEEYDQMLREEQQYELEYADEIREAEEEQERLEREYRKEMDEYYFNQ